MTARAWLADRLLGPRCTTCGVRLRGWRTLLAHDVSVAGGRAGLRDGTRTGLWSQVVRAITELQPRLVVLENVPGIFTADAVSDLDSDPRLLSSVRRRDGEPVLRALSRVLGDLAEIGFDADWTVVPASGVGAAHKRERWFCAAYPAGEPWSFEHGDGGAARDATSGRQWDRLVG